MTQIRQIYHRKINDPRPVVRVRQIYYRKINDPRPVVRVRQIYYSKIDDPHPVVRVQKIFHRKIISSSLRARAQASIEKNDKGFHSHVIAALKELQGIYEPRIKSFRLDFREKFDGEGRTVSNSPRLFGPIIFDKIPLPDITSLIFEKIGEVPIHGKIFSKRRPPWGKSSSLDNLLQSLLYYDDLKLFKPLLKFQPEGIRFLSSNRSALLADDPGLGKTIQATIALRILFQKGLVNRALIVVPKSTIGDRDESIDTGVPIQWEGHLQLWAPELKVWTVTSENRQKVRSGRSRRGRYYRSQPEYIYRPRDRAFDWRQEAHVFLTTYGLIRADIQNQAFPDDFFDVIVLDEAHVVKNPDSQQSIALQQLSAKYRWGLTGTPVQNYPRELYAIFQFLKPALFPRRSSKELEELSENNITETARPYYLRRKKSKDDLPPKTRTSHWVELTEDQKISYGSEFSVRRKRLIELLSQGHSEYAIRSSIRGAFIDLLQICNFDRNTYSSGKMNPVMEIIQKAVSDGEKILVFSRFVPFGIHQIHKKMSETNIQSLLFEGRMSQGQRNETLRSFRTSRDYNVLLATVFTGGVGLNLQEASTVIHFDHWWNPAVMWQAEDRAHRYGQKREVKVHSFFTKNTVEQRVYDLLKSKEKMINRILDNLGSYEAKDQIEKNIGIEELLAVFDL